MGLEQIVVTARKRTENLQDVPISILALGPMTLEQHGVVSLADISDGSMPGVNLAPYPGSSDFLFPTFRGITTNTVFISRLGEFALKQPAEVRRTSWRLKDAAERVAKRATGA